MRHRTHKSITFVLALLLALCSWVPTPGRAEAQMRCAGTSPHSAPCARTMLPATELTEAQVYNTLMPCCRFMRVSARQSCSMLHSVQPAAAPGTAAHRSGLSARRCLVTIHTAAASATAPAIPGTRWLLAAPALALPIALQSAFAPVLFTRSAFWTYAPTLLPHVLPHLHGLRAPPAA